MFGVFLVLAVALVGGLIAFVGDRVGMRVGKKRLTIFGLRPKYTSIAIAVLTGILTAVATLGILSAASESVRIAVFQLSRILRRLDEATAKNLRLKAEYDRVNAALAEVTGKWRTARTELAGINEKIAALSAARRRAEEALDEARTRLSTATTDLRQVRGQYDKAVQDLAAARREISFVEQRKDNLENAISLLEDRIDSLYSERESLGAGVVDLATQPIILHAGEVLVTRVVKPGKSFDEIDDFLADMLREVDRIARARGAAIERKEIGTRINMLSYSEAYQSLFDLAGPTVVRVVSNTNTIAGYPANVNLECLPDEVVFRRGEPVARIVLPGGGSPDDAFIRLAGELLPQARKAAETVGMATLDGTTPPPRLSLAALEKASALAAAAKGEVEVKLAAARDLRRAGDELELTVIVETH